ncbi:nitrate/nitrite transporter NrtS [Labilibaculum antarcticum]|uniref:Phosphoenolpyruvate protein kinase n=1 Tax=Labilibaculum antarcticum TaxID=1717717 RepID=A0A1Y1CN97_9BACT|nr:nitrate/nitrite transporter NrtS [Labilibaculum antarcticum]BAX81760.1 hypothetical protein ALGA_3462 [Labilibaculum antarcticum]
MKTKNVSYLQLATDKTSLFRALKVALFIGIILNLINNPQLFQVSSDTEIHLSRIILTFLVPFCVSLFSSVLANRNK